MVDLLVDLELDIDKSDIVQAVIIELLIVKIYIVKYFSYIEKIYKSFFFDKYKKNLSIGFSLRRGIKI
jgi:hypothetical protein